MKPVENKKILFVEDDAELLEDMTSYFSELGNVVYSACNLNQAKSLLKSIFDLDIIVLDVVLPDGSGLDLVRKDKVISPVIVLSDLGSEENILEGFESGVIDYVVKPCSMKLLETRISLRLLPKKEALIAAGDISINSATRTVQWRGKSISLTVSEFNILYFLISNRGTFYNANQIYENVWKAPALNSTTVKRHLSSLRLKIQEVAPNFNLLVTKFGSGYAFAECGEETK